MPGPAAGPTWPLVSLASGVPEREDVSESPGSSDLTHADIGI